MGELSLTEDHEFIVDLARYAEGSLSEQQVKKKYRFDSEVWARLGEDGALCERIEAEKIRRVRDGSAARELAQQAFVAAPGVLSGILTDGNANARHRIESARELRAISANGPESAPAADRFVITINLGADVVEHYNKSIAINADDPDDISGAPQGVIAVVAPNKDGSEGSGGSL
jgi:hypothetical protein